MIKAQASGHSKVPAGRNNRIEKRVRPMTNLRTIDVMNLSSPILDEHDLRYYLKGFAIPCSSLQELFLC